MDPEEDGDAKDGYAELPTYRAVHETHGACWKLRVPISFTPMPADPEEDGDAGIIVAAILIDLCSRLDSDGIGWSGCADRADGGPPA